LDLIGSVFFSSISHYWPAPVWNRISALCEDFSFLFDFVTHTECKVEEVDAVANANISSFVQVLES